ncbi:MAG TPA: hypothetical protein VMC03_18065 [Streptosporangiaceae bacterium]|nr:hypothetical protein [Streptosporangiaceae bacterium]
MPNFVFTYRTAPGTVRTPESAQAWRSWFDDMAGHVAEIGNPGLQSATVGNCGPGTKLGGFSLITAADLDEALGLAKACPALAHDGGVEVAELGEVPPRPAG